MTVQRYCFVCSKITGREHAIRHIKIYNFKNRWRTRLLMAEAAAYITLVLLTGWWLIFVK